MDNQIIIPFINPVQFYIVDSVDVPQYLSRHMDDAWFSEQLRAEQTRVNYKQKWTNDDAIKLQFQSNFDPIDIKVIDCNQNLMLSSAGIQRLKNKYQEGFYVYEDTISLASLAEGTYYILMTLGGTTRMISEPFEIVDGAGTLLFEFSNSKYHGDVIFETGIVFSMRMEAVLRNFDPGNERTAYIDQRRNPTVLKSIPYRTWEVAVGKDYGVPDWVADKLNWIFSCDNVTIDGKPYAVLEDSKITSAEFHPQYPLKSYSLKIQEGINRASKIIGVSVDPNKRLLIGMSIDSTIFGDTSELAGNNLIAIEAVE